MAIYLEDPPEDSLSGGIDLEASMKSLLEALLRERDRIISDLRSVARRLKWKEDEITRGLDVIEDGGWVGWSSGVIQGNLHDVDSLAMSVEHTDQIIAYLQKSLGMEVTVGLMHEEREIRRKAKSEKVRKNKVKKP